MTFIERVKENILLAKWVVKDCYDDYRIEHSNASDEDRYKQYLDCAVRSELSYIHDEDEEMNLLMGPLCRKVFDRRQKRLEALSKKMNLTEEQTYDFLCEVVAPYQKEFLDTLTEEELEELKKMQEEDCK